jgi:exopolyphosphatase / guanosine-5'-triphosphate,3'-diphosphate pyrophosphatase
MCGLSGETQRDALSAVNCPLPRRFVSNGKNDGDEFLCSLGVLMQEQASPMRAAIDIGSNTIHIVVARCTSDALDIVADEVEIIRIGESVTATGEISSEKRDDTISVLHKYKSLAEQHGADPVLVVATEAIRQAKNSPEFLGDVRRATGLKVQIIDGSVEAVLTFYGATYELYKEPNPPARVGALDLGGGSMELVMAKHRQISWHTSIPIGSGWLHDRYLSSNPPIYDEWVVARTFLATYFQGMHIRRNPPVLVVTGGSANSLLYLAQSAFGLDPAEPRLTHDDLVRCEGLLSALSAEEVARRYRQPLKRAQVLPAGALIIRMVMEQLSLDEIRISPHGIREGALLMYTRYGEQWLQRVREEAEATAPKKGNGSAGADAQEGQHEETFVQGGRRMLRERMLKLLEWRNDVLKRDDIEVVHKMRVASRRLRATLDAFESACEPRPFKKAYRHVKQLADVLGKTRDTDVMIQNLQQQLEHLPSEEQAGMQWLIDRLGDYRQWDQQVLEAFFEKKFDEDLLKQEIGACLPEGGVHHGKG